MALYPKLKTTNKGRDLVSKANANGKAVKYIKVVVGNGDFSGNIDTLLAPISPQMDITFNSGKDLGNGQWQLSFVLDNSAVNSGFYAKEVGVYAKMDGEDDSAAILFAYTNGGNYVDYIPDKSTPIDAQIFNADILVGDANQVLIQLANGTYATLQDLASHDSDENSHTPLLNKWVNKSFAKFREAVIAVVTETIVNILQITYRLESNGYIRFGLFGGFTIQWGSYSFSQAKQTYADIPLSIAMSTYFAIPIDSFGSAQTVAANINPLTWCSTDDTARIRVAGMATTTEVWGMNWVAIGKGI